MAGATQGTPVSPTPPGASVEATSVTEIAGAAFILMTGYVLKLVIAAMPALKVCPCHIAADNPCSRPP